MVRFKVQSDRWVKSRDGFYKPLPEVIFGQFYDVEIDYEKNNEQEAKVQGNGYQVGDAVDTVELDFTAPNFVYDMIMLFQKYNDEQGNDSPGPLSIVDASAFVQNEDGSWNDKPLKPGKYLYI